MPGATLPARLTDPADEERKPNGRPSKLTADTKSKILNALRMTHSVDDAAILGGIHPRSLYRWLERGKKAARGEYFEFWQECERAVVEGKALLVGRVHAGSRLRPELALKILARRFPKEWGPSAKIEVEETERPDAAALRERIATRLDAIEQRLSLASRIENAPEMLQRIAETFSSGADS
jgi:hypothetical protein